jgi:hypothetical protein
VRLKLREDHFLKVEARPGECLVGGPRGIRLFDLDDSQISLLKQLASDGLLLSARSSTSPSCRALVDALELRDLLISHVSDCSRTDLWASHLPAELRDAYQMLGSKRVAIVGCGGTGSIVADHLARGGVKSFVLVDYAKVDEPDLNRQLPYSRSDIGRLKTEALAKHLFENWGAAATRSDEKVEGTDQLKGLLAEKPIDLIVCCADTPSLVIQIIVARAAQMLGSAALFGSVGISDFVWGPLLNEFQAFDNFIELRTKQLEGGMGDRVAKASVCFTNTAASLEIAWLAYRFLLKEAAEKQMINTVWRRDVWTGQTTVHQKISSSPSI